MRIFPYMAAMLLLTACDPVVQAKSVYERDPGKRRVNVDDHQIYVLQEGFGHWVAWGGEDDKDGFVQYRQTRAIELISKCRVKSVVSKKTDPVLMASVKC